MGEAGKGGKGAPMATGGFGVRIPGVIEPGEGDASVNYERMIDAVAVHCCAVAGFGRSGTINVRLAHPIDKGHADCWTPRIPWQPIVMRGIQPAQVRHEEFGFVSIRMEYPLNGPSYDAWIIFPSGHSATYNDAQFVEIIASELIGSARAVYGSHCAIHLDHVPSIARPVSFGDNYAGIDFPKGIW